MRHGVRPRVEPLLGGPVLGTGGAGESPVRESPTDGDTSPGRSRSPAEHLGPTQGAGSSGSSSPAGSSVSLQGLDANADSLAGEGGEGISADAFIPFPSARELRMLETALEAPVPRALHTHTRPLGTLAAPHPSPQRAADHIDPQLQPDGAAVPGPAKAVPQQYTEDHVGPGGAEPHVLEEGGTSAGDGVLLPSQTGCEPGANASAVQPTSKAVGVAGLSEAGTPCQIFVYRFFRIRERKKTHTFLRFP